MSSIFTTSATFGWNVQGYGLELTVTDALHLDDSDHSVTDDVSDDSEQTLSSS